MPADWHVNTSGGLVPWRDFVGGFLSALPEDPAAKFEATSVRITEGADRSRSYEIRGSDFSISSVLARLEQETLACPVSQTETRIQVQAFADPDCRGRSRTITGYYVHPGSPVVGAVIQDARDQLVSAARDAGELEPEREREDGIGGIGDIRRAMTGGQELAVSVDLVTLLESMTRIHTQGIRDVQIAQATIFRQALAWADENAQRSRAALALYAEAVASAGNRDRDFRLAERQLELEAEAVKVEKGYSAVVRSVGMVGSALETAIKHGVITQGAGERLTQAGAAALSAMAPSVPSLD